VGAAVGRRIVSVVALGEVVGRYSEVSDFAFVGVAHDDEVGCNVAAGNAVELQFRHLLVVMIYCVACREQPQKICVVFRWERSTLAWS